MATRSFVIIKDWLIEIDWLPSTDSTDNSCSTILNSLQFVEVFVRRFVEHRVPVIESWTNNSTGHSIRNFLGNGWTNMSKCLQMVIAVLNNVINMWIQRECTIQSNTQNSKTVWNPNTASSQRYCRRPCIVHCKRLDVPKYATADLLGLSSSPLSLNQYCNNSTQPCKLSKAVANGTVILVAFNAVTSNQTAYWTDIYSV